ncbi:M20/M25/M40 family metallo-hydrolase [Pseudomonas sp. nanlin1]|uniref:M20/M25/M40 family metallo-hydrolase n=1 Tax=Pseudomonas sp. nanlin1 TaxID=3040605 RepID=UPI00388E0E68
MTDPKQTLGAVIDQGFAAQTEMLQALVRTPSDNPPGDCTPHAEVTARLLEAMGFTVERHTVPAAVVEAAGMVSATNLIVRHRFGPGPTIALNAHGDVVPPGRGWSSDPYGGEIREGWLYGRGAAVSKSDITTYAHALAALKTLDLPLAGSVELHITYDEETGGLAGPGWLLKEKLSAPDYVLSAAFSYHVITAHNGCLHLEVTLCGTSAHAAMPDTGVDAIEASVAVLQALYGYRDSLRERRSSTPGISHPTLIVGLIEGGINTNVVADRLTLRLDRRIIPEESPEAVEAELHELLIRAAAEQPGITLDIKRVLLARPFTPVAGSERLAALVCREAERVFAEPITPVGVPLYTDARLYSEAGIATVMYGAGPRTLIEANGHRADERVPLDDLRRATQVVANTLLELLSEGVPR